MCVRTTTLSRLCIHNRGQIEHTIFFDTPEDVVDIVWEEATRVEHGLDEAGNSPDRHVLCMGMSVPLIVQR